ncbi:hypothetical protein [Nonomuraea sp. NPDC049607]|uniref:hypothetical protein n=1 Tax=Nonomuraea sp. NPDC049607 TaxID=3154732 RepID=UPI0034135FF6
MRLLLDTNVWSRLADWNLEEVFYRYIKSSGVDVVIAPATLLELLKTPHKASRLKKIKLVCRSRWVRLPTEAKSEADEVVAEITRLHPEWLRTSKDLARQARLQNLWGYIKWQEARSDEDYLIAEARSNYQNEKEWMVRAQKEQQKAWRSDGYLRYPNEIAKAISQLPTFTPDPKHERLMISQGWRQGEPIEIWRTQAHMILMSVLFDNPPHTYFDWIGIYVDISALQNNHRAFGEMLLHEVEAARMRRNWLRWAVDFAQHAMKVGQGNPMDGQLSSYLYDANLFITRDKRFSDILNEVRQVSPCNFATTIYSHADEKGLIDEIKACITSAR